MTGSRISVNQPAKVVQRLERFRQSFTIPTQVQRSAHPHDPGLPLDPRFL